MDGSVGCGEVEKLRTGGVSYGTLLAQRDVGSAWNARHNRSNNEVSRLMVRRVFGALDDAGVGYWSAEGDAAVAKSFLGGKAGVSGKPPGQFSVVTCRQDGAADHAVLIAIARDGGTARKQPSTRLRVPAWIQLGTGEDVVPGHNGGSSLDVQPAGWLP